MGYMKNKLKMIYCVSAYSGCSIYLTCNAMLKHSFRCHPESVCPAVTYSHSCIVYRLLYWPGNPHQSSFFCIQAVPLLQGGFKWGVAYLFLNPYYNYNTRSNMQVASLQATTSKLQQNISQLPEKRQRGRNWAWSGLLSVNQTDVNSITLAAESRIA